MRAVYDKMSFIFTCHAF